MMIKLILIFLISIFLSNTNAILPKMAVLLEGQISDLAHNYVVNKGAGLTETFLNVTGNLVVENVNTYDLVFDNVNTLAAQGFNYFITGDEIQMGAALDAARRYKQLYFLIAVDSTQPLPSLPSNVASYTRNVVAPFYLLGVLAGYLSNHTGLVVPGPTTENYYTVNAFYSGAQSVNPNFNLTVVSTSSYDDVDTAAGAINILANQSITLITQSQDTMQVSEYFLDHSINALGSNGFAQDLRYGEKIYQSILYDYSQVFIYYGQQIISNNFTSSNFYGDFTNQFYQLGSYSFLVSSDIRDKVTLVQTSLMTGNNSNYLCSPFNQQLYGQQCITYQQMLGMTTTYSGVQNLGYYAVPLTEVYDRQSINNAFISVTSIQIFAGVAVAFVCVLLRNRLPIAYSNLLFCLGLALGAILVPIAILLWNIREKTVSQCIARIWMASLGYTFIIGLMIIKNTRIYLKFQELIRKKSDKLSPIKPASVYTVFGALLAVNLLLLAVFTGVGGVNRWNSLGLDGIGQYEYVQECVNNYKGDVMLYAILCFHGIQLLYGCFISWKTRLVDLEEFEETHDFSSVTYLISFTTFIVIPLMSGITTHRSRDAIISSVAIFTSFSSLLIIFGSKFWKIYKPVEDDGLPQIKLQKLPATTKTSAVSTLTRNNFLTAVTNPTASQATSSAIFD